MKISVIAPTFNAAPLLQQFTASILHQVLKPFEVVLVNDGSSDDTAAQLELVASRLHAAGVSCKVVEHGGNWGRGAARNSGLAAASGEYITWLDVDDVYGPHRIANLVRALKAAEVSSTPHNWLLSSSYVRLQEKDLSKRSTIIPRDLWQLKDLFEEDGNPTTLQLQSLAGPRRCFEWVGFDATLNWAEDFDFALRFLDRGGVVLADHLSPSSDILYFQSFRSANEETVLASNRVVLTKLARALQSQGVNPDAVLERKRQRYIRNFRPVSRRDSGIAKVDSVTGQINLAEVAGKVELRAVGSTISMSVTEAGFLFEGLRNDLKPSFRSVAFRDSGGQIVVSEDLGVTRDVILPNSMVLRAISCGAVAGEINSGPLASSRYHFILVRSGEGVLIPLPQRSSSHKMSNFSFATVKAENQFVSQFSRVSDGNNDTIFVSFYSGPPYYGESARRLAEQLAAQDVDYDICEYKNNHDEAWIETCRKKIAFYKFQSDKHKRPIMWLDADTQIIGDLSRYRSHQTDFGAFLRNFKYFIGHDPLQFSRTFHPGYLHFGAGPRAQDFLAHLLEASQDAPSNATDDYVLQQGLETFERKLEMAIFSPDDIAVENGSHQENAVFLHGDSGNVQVARSSAAQHSREIVSIDRQKAVLSLRAKTMVEKGRLDDAIVYLRDLRELDRTDVVSLTSLLRVYSKTGNEGKYKYHFDRNKDDHRFRLPIFRVHLDHLMRTEKIKQAREAAEILNGEGSAADKAFVQSRLYRHSYDIEAIEAVKEDKRLNMFWWEQPHPGNLGDIIGPYIVHKLSGAFPHFSVDAPRLLTVGSIIKFAKASDTVWGSGASAADQKIATKATFKAVRGPLTRDMLIKSGAECPDVFGDPAWFLPKVFDCSSVRKTHRLGLIRHFIHADSTVAVGDDVRDISIIRGSVREIERFLEELNSCEAIISTSLHGLIIANAYGIPACLAVDSSSTRQIHGDGMKFSDYALSVGVERFIPFDLASVDRVTGLLSEVCTHNPRKLIDLVRLAEAAPFEVTLPLSQLR